MPDPTASVEAVQRSVNSFTTKYLKGVTPLRVDGKKGRATNSRILAAKFYLGYGNGRDAKVTRVFLQRLKSPHNRTLFPPAMFSSSFNRRAKQRVRATEQSFRASVSPGVTKFDGVPCAVWLAKRLQQARNGGRWKGRLVSGWRSPSYSRSLCMNMCGAPSCPGKCAGTSSNHSGSVYPHGAVDVSDYAVFGTEAARLGLGIHNSLGAQDPVHFSVAGN